MTPNDVQKRDLDLNHKKLRNNVRQIGPWRRSTIAAGEGQAGMLLDSLTMPMTMGFAGDVVGFVVQTSQPVTAGQLNYTIEKDGAPTGAQASFSTGSEVIALANPLPFVAGTKLRALLDTSQDLAPVGMDSLVWLLIDNVSTELSG